jgi:hypothetical protein
MSTITSAVLGVAGTGASAAQAIQQNKLMKQANQAAKTAAQNIRSIREQNPFAAIQVPTTGTKMAMDQINQSAANSLAALQGAGAEGVIGGVGTLNKSVRDANLEVGAELSDRQFNRDMAQADAQSGINARKANREYMTEMAALEGAQMAASDAQYNKNAAIQSGFGALSGAIGEFANTDKFDYKTIRDRIRKKKASGQPLSKEEQDLLDGEDQNQTT